MSYKARQNGQFILKSSDNMWSTGGGNGKPLQYSCHENPMNSMKRQKDTTPEDELPKSEDVQYATRDEWRPITRAPEREKQLGQSENNAQLWMCLVMKVKSDAVKNNIA